MNRPVMGGPTNPSTPSGAADQHKAPLLKGIEYLTSNEKLQHQIEFICGMQKQYMDLVLTLIPIMRKYNNYVDTDPSILGDKSAAQDIQGRSEAIGETIRNYRSILELFHKYRELSAVLSRDGVTQEEATAARTAMDELKKQFRIYEGYLNYKSIYDTLKSCTTWIADATDFIAGFKHEGDWEPMEEHHYASGRSAESPSNTASDVAGRRELEDDICYLFSNDRETAVGSGEARDAAPVPGAQQTISGSPSGSFGDAEFQARIIHEYLNKKEYYNAMYLANNDVNRIRGLAGKLLTEETLTKVQSNTDPEFEKLKEAYEVASEAYNELRDELPTFQLVWDTYREYDFARRELTRKELTEVEKAALTARMSGLEQRLRGHDGFLDYGQLCTFIARCGRALPLMQHLNEMVEELSSEEANVTGGEAASATLPEAATAPSDNGRVAGKGDEDASEIKEPSAAPKAELDNNGHVNEMASTGGGILRGAPVTTANNPASTEGAASPTLPVAAAASPRSQEHVEQDTDTKVRITFRKAPFTTLKSGQLTFSTGALCILAAVFIMAAM
ncbi:phosphoenolpyruvate carboxylase, putative [Babesia caballi]|uniref:Phosphoenolpyruvate carboxylase, putative n=1 Tax=Babesia caballi TaxID=5871 RepID=A0AAV4LQG0_BABCB|nr:phosphoenolpyruvate carboxylase, putative [Babesia caballi]